MPTPQGMRAFLRRQIPWLVVLLCLGLFSWVAWIFDSRVQVIVLWLMLLCWFVCNAVVGPLVNVTASTSRFVARQLRATTRPTPSASEAEIVPAAAPQGRGDEPSPGQWPSDEQ